MGSAKERALVSVAEQIGDFRESHSRVGQIVLRQFVARGVNKIRERCALLSQPALESVIASAGWSVAVPKFSRRERNFLDARTEGQESTERPQSFLSKLIRNRLTIPVLKPVAERRR